MKAITGIAVIVIIVVAIAGVGIGYLAGGNKTTTQYSTVTQTTTATATQDLSGYWTTAYSYAWKSYQISDATLANLLNSGNSSIYILDVREPTGTASYTAGHIPGAINIPYQNVTAAVNSNILPKDKMIVVICYTGQWASQSMAMLRAIGYNAFSLSSGMAGWNNATRVSAYAPMASVNYPIVSGTSPGTWAVFTQ